MIKIQPVILAGGSGTRLWPLSRKSYPKQFSKVLGKKTLFQQSALRVKSSDKVKFRAPITVTNSDFRFIVKEQLNAIGIDSSHILIEPEAKNTAPAILAASLFSQIQDPECVLFVAPSDHIIPDNGDFHTAILKGLLKVQEGKMVTFGISPTQPETGYGYLEIPKYVSDNNFAFDVVKFVEKPDKEFAEKMIEEGNFLWNAGIFMFRTVDMISHFKKLSSGLLKNVSQAVTTATVDLGFVRLNPKPWAELESISIDYAIMEKATNLVTVPYSSKWSDLGGWDAVWMETAKDPSFTATSETAHSVDCSNTLLRSENPNQHIVGLGLDNILAISMPDAVLIAHKERAQDVKKVVDLLKARNVPQAEVFPKDHRPWGWFESLALGDTFQVKRICVSPGASLSLQSHRHRSEHWIVVEGRAKVTIGDMIKVIEEGQSVYVPMGEVHRMENPGEELMVLIEVQIGNYLGEDDIVRYEDCYARD